MADDSSDNTETPSAAPTIEDNDVDDVKGNPWDSPPQSPVNGVVQPRIHAPADKPTKHTNQLEYLLNVILKDTWKKNISWPFRAPVDAVALQIPEYHKVIKKPMDLATIMTRVKNTYYCNAQEAVEDLMRMFNNCYTFNPPHFGVYGMAKQLEEYVLKRLNELPAVEEEMIKTAAKRGPKGKKNKNINNDPNKVKDEELTPEDKHVIDHFHRATRAMSSLPDEKNIKPTDLIKDSPSRESSVVSIQQKDADSSIIDGQEDNEPLASTSSSIPETVATSSKVGVKRKADTTTFDDETSAAKINSRRESSRPVKKPNLFLDYNTPMTPIPQRKTKSSEAMKFCQKLLTELHSRKYIGFMWPFYKPVDVVGLGLNDYFEIITHPMDLSTIKKKLDRKEYATPHEFAEDIRLIAKNCSVYNAPNTDVYVHGVDFLKLFEGKFRDCPAEDDYLDMIPLTVQTDLNDDEKLNSVLSMIKTEQKKASERVDQLRALHEKMYETLLHRREAKLNGTTPPIVDNAVLIQMERLGIPSAAYSSNDTSGDDMISPTTSVRSSSRAPVPKVFDDVKMEVYTPKPAPVKKSVSRPSVTLSAEVVPVEPPKLPDGTVRRGRRPGSKNKPKNLAPKKIYEFDSEDDSVNQPMSYNEKVDLSAKISRLEINQVSEVVKIIDARKAKTNTEMAWNEEMEIDFEQLDNVTLRELEAYVNAELNCQKKPKKLMPIKNPAEAERKKQEIQAELQELNAPIPTLNDIGKISAKSSAPVPPIKKPRLVCSESSSSGSDSSSSSSSDSSDSEGPRLDELTSRKKTPLPNRMKKKEPTPVPNPLVEEPPKKKVEPPPKKQVEPPKKKSVSPVATISRPASVRSVTRESTPMNMRRSKSRTASPKPESQDNSPADILARSYVHPKGHAKIENMPVIHPTFDASISILDQILPENLNLDAEKMKRQREKERREKEAREAEIAQQRRIEHNKKQQEKDEQEEQLMLLRQAEARRKRQLELADTVGVNEQQEMMFNFETNF